MNMKKHKIITFFVSFLMTKIFCNSPIEMSENKSWGTNFYGILNNCFLFIILCYNY